MRRGSKKIEMDKRNKIYKFRKEFNLTSTKMGELMGVSHSQILKLEKMDNPNKLLRMDQLSKLSKNLRLDICEVVNYFID